MGLSGDREERRAATYATRMARLRALGVPSEIADDLATRRESLLGFAGGLFLMAPLLGLLFAGVRWGGRIADWPWRNAARAGAGAWVWGSSAEMVGLAGVFGIFALICAYGWATSSLYRLAGPHPAPSLAGTLLRDTPFENRPFSDWVTRRSVAFAATEMRDTRVFLRRFAAHASRGWGICALVLSIPMAWAAVVGFTSYWTADARGVVRHEPGFVRTYRWAEATGATTGCSTTSRDLNLTYRVRFPGWTVDMGGAAGATQGMPSPARVQGLIRVNQVLRKLGRAPVASAADAPCTAYWSQRAGPDGAAAFARSLIGPRPR